MEEKVSVSLSDQAGMRALVFVEGPGIIKQGSDVEMKIMIEYAKDLSSAPLTIQYDSSKLLFVNAVEGSFLSKDNQATVFKQTAFPGKGKILIALKQAGEGAGTSGMGELCRLKFKAIGSGSAVTRIARTDFLNVQSQVIATDKFEYPVVINP